MKLSKYKIMKEFDKRFVIPDTKAKDILFWEEVTPELVKDFIEKYIDIANKEIKRLIETIDTEVPGEKK